MTPLVAALAALAVVGLLCCSAFFSSAETAIVSLPSEWVAAQSRAKDSRVATLQRLYDDPHRLLVTLLVGNNVVNIAISSIITAVLVDALPSGVAVVAATLVASIVLLVFGEIVPKSYGLGNATRWSLVVAGPLRLVERALSPAITVLDWITRRMSALIPVDAEIEKPYLD